MLYFLDIFGTLAFAVSGAFRAVKYELDLLGVLTLATVTGIAGGIIRDVVLGSTPPAGLVDPWYILICIAGGVVVFFAAPKVAGHWDNVMLADAVGLSVFTAIGASSAEQCGATPLTVILMAMISSCGGGVIRDLLVSEIPSVLKKDFYASAALCGGACYVLLGRVGLHQDLRIVYTILVTFAIRGVAMKYGLNLPRAKALNASPSQIAEDRKSKRENP